MWLPDLVVIVVPFAARGLDRKRPFFYDFWEETGVYSTDFRIDVGGWYWPVPPSED